MKDGREDLVRKVARRALREVELLTPAARADIYEGVSLILKGDEAAAAKLAAFSLRESEQHQLKFRELLKS